MQWSWVVSGAAFVVVTFKTTEVEPTLVSSDIVYFFPPLNCVFKATEIFVDRRYFWTTDVPAGGCRKHGGGDKESTAFHLSPRFVDMQGVWAQISRHSRLLRGQQIRSPKRSS